MYTHRGKKRFAAQFIGCRSRSLDAAGARYLLSGACAELNAGASRYLRSETLCGERLFSNEIN